MDLEYEFDSVQQTPKLTKLNRLFFFCYFRCTKGVGKLRPRPLGRQSIPEPGSQFWSWVASCPLIHAEQNMTKMLVSMFNKEHRSSDMVFCSNKSSGKGFPNIAGSNNARCTLFDMNIDDYAHLTNQQDQHGIHRTKQPDEEFPAGKWVAMCMPLAVPAHWVSWPRLMGWAW